MKWKKKIFNIGTVTIKKMMIMIMVMVDGQDCSMFFFVWLPILPGDLVSRAVKVGQ